jgi:hypothetical protein
MKGEIRADDNELPNIGRKGLSTHLSHATSFETPEMAHRTHIILRVKGHGVPVRASCEQPRVVRRERQGRYDACPVSELRGKDGQLHTFLASLVSPRQSRLNPLRTVIAWCSDVQNFDGIFMATVKSDVQCRVKPIC